MAGWQGAAAPLSIDMFHRTIPGPLGREATDASGRRSAMRNSTQSRA